MCNRITSEFKHRILTQAAKGRKITPWFNQTSLLISNLLIRHKFNVNLTFNYHMMLTCHLSRLPAVINPEPRISTIYVPEYHQLFTRQVWSYFTLYFYLSWTSWWDMLWWFCLLTHWTYFSNFIFLLWAQSITPWCGSSIVHVVWVTSLWPVSGKR